MGDQALAVEVDKKSHTLDQWTIHHPGYQIEHFKEGPSSLSKPSINPRSAPLLSLVNRFAKTATKTDTRMETAMALPTTTLVTMAMGLRVAFTHQMMMLIVEDQ